MTRIDIINNLISRYGYRSYLEIGVHTGVSFESILCDEKVGVDPSDNYPNISYKLTSDEFFAQNNKKFDVVFIDGLHLNEQVQKDFENAFNCLNDGGAIVLHDCNPTEEIWQFRAPAHGHWTGDTWKAWARIIRAYPMNITFTVDDDFGVGVFIKNSNVENEIQDIPELCWDYLQTNRKGLIKLISSNDFLKFLGIIVPTKLRVAVVSANLGGMDDAQAFTHPKQKMIGAEIDIINLTDANFPTRKSLHPRLQAKIPKMLAYELYPGYDYYVWLDGNFSLKNENSVKHFVENCKGFDACFFDHPERKFVGEEFDYMMNNMPHLEYLISRYGNDFFEEQKNLYYSNHQYSNANLHALGSFIYSKSIIEKQEFNIFQQWFYHCSRYSVQDQLSLPYLMLKNIDFYNFGKLEGCLTGENKYVTYHWGH